MKQLTFAILLLAFSIAVHAQNPYVIIDTASKKPWGAGNFNNTLLKQGSISHSTSKGDIYILPYDKMPCLVPDMQQVAPMPGSIQTIPESRMPNAIPRKRMIPENKK